MIRSVRGKLTLWHSAVFGALLVLFAGAAYTFMARAIRAREERVLLEAVDGLRDELRNEREDQDSDVAAARQVVRELRFRGLGFVIYDSVGGTIAAREASTAPPPPGEDPDPAFDPRALGTLVAKARPRSPMMLSIGDREGGYLAAVAPMRLRPTLQFVAVVGSQHDLEETLEAARLAIAIALPIGLLLAAIGGYLLAQRSLAPMVAMRDRAAHITATNLGERLPIVTPEDEVGRLAAVINDLLARLERAFVQQRQFMADASHELRTPAAVVQSEASVALSRSGRTAREYEESLEVIRKAGQRLRRIVDDLFLLARADAGDVPLRPAPLYLDDLLFECVHSLRTFSEARGLVMSVHAEPAPYTGDEELLRRLVTNLLDNAIKHSPYEGEVSIRLERRRESYRLSIADQGSGIPAEVQARVFERFVRADTARGSEAGATGGAGLGLAIARWIAEAHGARLTLERSGPEGSVFALVLPVQSEAPTAE